MIDVSYQSMQSGMVKKLTRELHTILDDLPKEAGMEESLIKVGFVTYSNNLHFYNVKVLQFSSCFFWTFSFSKMFEEIWISNCFHDF